MTLKEVVIGYRILHHIPGRIRIEVPAIKRIPISELKQMFSALIIPEGIKNIRPNPFTGTVVITYDPDRINIIDFLKKIASIDEMQRLMKDEG